MKAPLLAAIAAAACATTTHQGPSPGVVPPARFTAADVHFMAGMIAHHAQAVLIAGWAPSHAAGAAVRAFCERVVVGQTGRIVLLQRRRPGRHETGPEVDTSPPSMPGL